MNSLWSIPTIRLSTGCKVGRSEKADEPELRVRRGVILFFNDGGAIMVVFGVLPMDSRLFFFPEAAGVCDGAKEIDFRPPRLGVMESFSKSSRGDFDIRTLFELSSISSDIDVVIVTTSDETVSYAANFPAWPLGNSIFK